MDNYGIIVASLITSGTAAMFHNDNFLAALMYLVAVYVFITFIASSKAKKETPKTVAKEKSPEDKNIEDLLNSK